MSIEYVCPSCNATASVPPQAAGQTLPCPNCGKSCVIPSAPAASERPVPSLVFSPSVGPPLGPEPWYYSFIVAYAMIFLALSVLLVLCVLVFLVFISAQAGDRAVFTWGVAYVFFWFLGILFLVALSLLLVDMARNLRHIRQQTRR